MVRVWLLILLTISFESGLVQADDGVRHQLDYAPAPANNPLKGLVPYVGDWEDRFPHSMEFSYLPLSSLVTGLDRYDWSLLERLLDDCASRGHQAVFRVYLEYPDKTDGIPSFLISDGLKVHKYRNSQEKPPTNHVTPDYRAKNLREVLLRFINALGKKFDGDPRIGFITAGLLGYWGEWHTYPREDLFADRDLQMQVMDAYEAAFKITPILLRYPVGESDETKAPNSERRFGYHDDSFAWATLDTGRADDDWFFMPALRSAGTDAMTKWKTQPIGGEIRPEAWGKVFDKTPGAKEIQDFRKCVNETHVSWLMDSGMFELKQDSVREKRAEEEVRRMGYEFHVSAVIIGHRSDGRIPVSVSLENRGVAPFYYPWKAEYGLLAEGKLVKSLESHGQLTGLLPGDKPRSWEESLDFGDLVPGKYKLMLRIPNPLPKGNPVRFANRSQDADLSGWLTLGDLQAK